MAAEGFFKPSKTIAAILILTPLVLTFVAQLLQVFSLYVNPTLILIINSMLAPIVPSLFIAATFLLKFKKTLSYYLTFYLPYTIFEIIFPFAVGAIPLSAFSSSFSLLFLLILFSPILVFLIFNPFFFVWLPRKLLRIKRYGAAAVCGLVYLVVVRFAFLVTSSLESGQAYTYALTNLEIFSDALYLVLIVIYSGLLFLHFKKMLKHSQ